MASRYDKERSKLRQAAKEELVRITIANGGSITASEVVARAEDEDSPMHSEFEWDDSIAGHEYRLNQARKFIRVARLVWVPSDAPTEKAISPAVSGDPSREGSYHQVNVVVKRPDLYARALEALIAKMRSAIAAVEELKAAAESAENPDHERMARITMAITALQTAGAAVQALH